MIASDKARLGCEDINDSWGFIGALASCASSSVRLDAESISLPNEGESGEVFVRSVVGTVSAR